MRNAVSFVCRSARANQTPGHWPGNLVYQIICGACAYGDLELGGVPVDNVTEARNVVASLTNPVHLLGMNDLNDINMFMQAVGREQFGYQHQVSQQEIGRYKWIYRQLFPKNLTGALQRKLCADPCDIIYASQIFCMAFFNEVFESPISRVAADLVRFKVLPWHSMLLFEYVGVTVGQIRKYYHDRLQNIEDRVFFWADRPLLVSRPLIMLDSENFICPFPEILPRAVYKRMGDLVRSDNALSNGFGLAFQRYTQLLLEDLSNSVISFPDEESRKESRCDFRVELPGGVLYVEAKAVRVSHDKLSPRLIQEDSSTKRVAEAAIQMAASIEREDERRYGIVIVDDYIYDTHTSWYRSMYKNVSPESADAISHFDDRFLVWSHHDLELLVMLCNATGETAVELLEQYFEQDEHLRGDWRVWISNRYSTVDIRVIPWVRNMADILEADFSGPGMTYVDRELFRADDLVARFRCFS